jgi:IS30 family transposase
MPSVTLAPASGRFLSFAEREEIARLRARGPGVREIARQLGRSPSTISRELRRKGRDPRRRVRVSRHDDAVACRSAWAAPEAREARREPRVAPLCAGPPVRGGGASGRIAVDGPEVRWIGRRHGRRADRRWARSWSPEQISNRLRLDFPDDESMRVSHEAIYQCLYVQGRGALRRELTACLRTGRAEADDRAVPGHWEGGLILGLGSSAIGTLVERSSRFTTLLHLPPMDGRDGRRVNNGPALAGHGAETVRDAIADTISTLPAQLCRSLTWDQGAEMVQHAQLRIDTGLQIYFCDPQCPWQRATNENSNGLLRQYFPKGTDLARHVADDLAAVAAALNTRPRKTLGWRTPAEVLAIRTVASRSTFRRSPLAAAGRSPAMTSTVAARAPAARPAGGVSPSAASSTSASQTRAAALAPPASRTPRTGSGPTSRTGQPPKPCPSRARHRTPSSAAESGSEPPTAPARC